TPNMVLQGQDQPVHLGGMIFATKGVAQYFADDLAPGDVIYHNDPLTGGSHLPDMTMYKPVFFKGELMFWTVNRSHMDETGGPLAGGYNPLAEEIWAEGLRISPVKVYAGGKRRNDVIDFMATNFRTRRQWLGDFGAQLASVTVAERRLLHLLEHYGSDTVRASLQYLLNRAERLMREEIQKMPDGEYLGRTRIESDGHGSGDMELRAIVEIRDDEMFVRLEAPPTMRSYINSYPANSIGGVYLGIVTFTDPEIPHNEGMYRPIHVDLGPKGTIVNAEEPAACSMSTSVPYTHIAEAVRMALVEALPDRAGGGWSKICQDVFSGMDPRNHYHYVFLSHFFGGGGGAFWGQDGEPAVGPIEVAGAATTGNVEDIEHMLPLHVPRFEFDENSAGAGRWRGGWGTILEIGPVDHTAQVNFLGDGMKFPPPGVLGASSPHDSERVYRKRLIGGGASEPMKLHTVRKIPPGYVIEIHSPGGGGVGNPFEREPEAVLKDVHSGLLSIEHARDDYKVVITQQDGKDPAIDWDATAALRNS